MPFLQIRELGLRYQKPQLGLSGGVINVPTDISRIQHALPQKLNESDTIAIEIKRSLKLKNAYAIGRIHLHLVIKALKQLCKRTLYKLEKVTIIDKWNEEFMKNIKAYETEIDIEDQEFHEQINEEPMTKTMGHGFTYSYNTYDLRNNQINIAPLEGYIPL